MVQPDTWPPDSMGWFSSVLQGIQFSHCFVKFWTGMLVLGSGMTWLNWPRSQTGPYITCTVLYNACMNSSIVPFSFWHQVHQNFVMLALQHLLNSKQREAWFSPHLLSKGLAASLLPMTFFGLIYTVLPYYVNMLFVEYGIRVLFSRRSCIRTSLLYN